MAQTATSERAAESALGILTSGERIALLRRRRKMSQRDLARAAGLSHSALSGYERDENSPSGEAIRQLAIVLETSADFLLRLSSSPSPSHESTRMYRYGKRGPRHPWRGPPGGAAAFPTPEPPIGGS